MQGVDDNDDVLITECLRHVSGSGKKRVRDVAWEELWAAGGDHVPDFSTLPKEIWGMIAARCEVSKEMLITLMSLNKGRISEMVWRHFNFPPNWDYSAFTLKFLHKWHLCWRVFGVQNILEIFKPVQQFVESHIAGHVWRGLTRKGHTRNHLFSTMSFFSGTHALICISKLLSVYVPAAVDIGVLSELFRNVGCTIKWLDNFKTLLEKTKDVNIDLKPVPTELTNIKAPITSVHVALGYYNEYRDSAFRDYGVRLPRIELNLD